MFYGAGKRPLYRLLENWPSRFLTCRQNLKRGYLKSRITNCSELGMLNLSTPNASLPTIRASREIRHEPPPRRRP